MIDNCAVDDCQKRLLEAHIRELEERIKVLETIVAAKRLRSTASHDDGAVRFQRT